MTEAELLDYLEHLDKENEKMRFEQLKAAFKVSVFGLVFITVLYLIAGHR